jgi:hypothetical protein
MSLRLLIEELSSLCHRIGDPSSLRLRIDKPSSSRRWGAAATVSSDQGASVIVAPDRRAATVMPSSDREVITATPSDLGSIVGHATGGHRHFALSWNRRRPARLGGRPTLVHRGRVSKIEP